MKPAVGPSLSLSVPESFKGGKLTICFNASDEFRLKTVESNSAKIGEIIGGIIGTNITIGCSVKKTTEEKKNNSELDDLIAREPIIGAIIERFNGEINESWRE